MDFITTALHSLRAEQAAKTAAVVAPAVAALEQLNETKLLAVWQREKLRFHCRDYQELLSGLSSAPTDYWGNRWALTRRGRWLSWVLPTRIFRTVKVDKTDTLKKGLVWSEQRWQTICSSQVNCLNQGLSWRLILPNTGPVDDAFLAYHKQHVINPATATPEHLASELERQALRLLSPASSFTKALRFCREFPRWNPIHLRGNEGQSPGSSVEDAFTEMAFFQQLVEEFIHRKKGVSIATTSQPEAAAPPEPFAALLLNYTLPELTALLKELGLLDETCKATPAASPGAWVGVIYGLLEARRPRIQGSKAAIWRAFSAMFGAVGSERAVQNGLGTRGSIAEQFRDRALENLNG